MKKHKNDFKEKRKSTEHFYDLEFDYDLIVSSFAMQYGIRLSHEPDISVSEYYRLLAGIMPETPLGKIVQIRMEKDPKILKEFGDYERDVRSKWAEFKVKNHKKEVQLSNEEQLRQLQNELKRLFS